jgi:hypothetical protein
MSREKKHNMHLLLVFTICLLRAYIGCICGAIARARAPVGLPHFPRDEGVARALHAFESQGFSVAIASAATPSMTGDLFTFLPNLMSSDVQLNWERLQKRGALEIRAEQFSLHPSTNNRGYTRGIGTYCNNETYPRGS